MCHIVLIDDEDEYYEDLNVLKIPYRKSIKL